MIAVVCNYLVLGEAGMKRWVSLYLILISGLPDTSLSEDFLARTVEFWLALLNNQRMFLSV